MAKSTGKPRTSSDKKTERKPRTTAKPAPKGEKERESKRGTRGSGRVADEKRKFVPREEKAPVKRAPKPWEREDSAKDAGGSRYGSKPGFKGGKYIPRKREESAPKRDDGLMRLNRFLSNAGIASRRDADKLIELGLVQVNGKVVTELGLRVDPKIDVVKYDDKSLKPEKQQYVLLNKPKDYLTTMDDPAERKTVMHLIMGACKERVYPIGRLDRNTTGLLLFTNDGEMARRLTSPKNGFPKIYHVETIEKIKGEHIDAIREGVKLEDGFVQAEEISLVDGDPRQVGIKLNTGKDKIIRALFEHFKYTVKKLDRVMYSSLTKRDLPRGRYRHLTEQEVNFLRMIR